MKTTTMILLVAAMVAAPLTSAANGQGPDYRDLGDTSQEAEKRPLLASLAGGHNLASPLLSASSVAATPLVVPKTPSPAPSSAPAAPGLNDALRHEAENGVLMASLDGGHNLAPIAARAHSGDAGPLAAPNSPLPPVAVAVTPPVVDSIADAPGVVIQLIGAVRGGQWRLVASLVLVLMMFGLAKFRDKVKWFKGDRGGSVLVGVLAVGAALPTALMTDVPLDLRLLVGALAVAWTSVGGYTWAKQIIWPRDMKPGNQ